MRAACPYSNEYSQARLHASRAAQLYNSVQLARVVHCNGPANVQRLRPWALNTACRHLVRNPNIAWEDVPDLPNAAKQILADRFAHCTSQVVNCQTSASKDTSKLLLRLQDGMEVEAVIMHYDTSGVWVLYLAVLWLYAAWPGISAVLRRQLQARSTFNQFLAVSQTVPLKHQFQ